MYACRDLRRMTFTHLEAAIYLVGVATVVSSVVYILSLTSKLENCLHGYKYRFKVRSLVLSLPVKWMGVLWDVFQCWRQKHDVATCGFAKGFDCFQEESCAYARVYK